MPEKEKAPLVRIFQKEGYGVKCGTWEVGSRSHRHIKLTSTYGTILTEHLLNAGGKTSDFQEPRKSPYNQAGKKKKEKGIGMGPPPLGGPSGAGRPARRSDPAGRTGVGAGGARKDAWLPEGQGADYTSSGGGRTRCRRRGFPEWAPTPALPEASTSRMPARPH